MALQKFKLSGSTNGRLIKVVPIVTPGTLLHTADATALDEIFLYVVNSDATDRKLTVEWGGVASPDDLIELTITAESGLALVVPGLLLQRTNYLLKATMLVDGNGTNTKTVHACPYASDERTSR